MRKNAGAHAVAVEATEEKRIVNQLTTVTSKASPVLGSFTFPPDTPDLPNTGKFDHLLEKGRAIELCAQLAYIFRNDPPVTCGATNGRTAGLSCDLEGDYMEQAFSPDAVVNHLYLAESFWDHGPRGNLLQLSVPSFARLIIVGDTHGQLEDVLWMFFKYGLPSARNIYLFNGDIVDRGGHALEILLLLFAFKRDMPNSMHILRGNHEDSICIVQYGFKSELESKFHDSMSPVWDACCNVVFPLMPIAAVVEDAKSERRFFVVHGGIPEILPERERYLKLGDLPDIERTRSTVQQHDHDLESYILFNLLWADPCETAMDREEDSRGDQFTVDDASEFCDLNNLDGIVRSHEVPATLRGVSRHHNGLTFTVFSASNYTGNCENRGGVLMCSGQPLRLAVCEHWAPPWKKLADILPFSFGESEEVRLREVRAWETEFGIGPEGFVDVEVADLEDLYPEDDDDYATFTPASPQELQFMAERIVEHKDDLFCEFRRCDPACQGILSKDDWASCMYEVLGPHCGDIFSREFSEALYEGWDLHSPVEYVRFLHRFQLRDHPAMDDSMLVDKIAAIALLQKYLVDFSHLNLSEYLDPDGDDTVSLKEFAEFLPKFHVMVPPEQASALYETMSKIVRQNPITLDSAILCFSLISQDPPPKSQWTDMCEALGRAITEAEISFPGAFRMWDTDRSGFLSLEELEAGLKKLDMHPPIKHDEVEACMREIDGRGISNNRVSIFEFIRAVAPRKMTMVLQKSMIKELLKRVWRFRPLLLALLSECDPNASNTVSCDTFRMKLWDLNLQLEPRGFRPLTDPQIRAICEIAAHGGSEIRYDHFLHTLHVEDSTMRHLSARRGQSSTGYDIRMLPKGVDSAGDFFWESQAIDRVKDLTKMVDKAREATRELRAVAKRRARSV